MTATLLLGDCREVMAGMAAESVDAIVTDPPYGLEFMGKEWDRLGGRPVDTRLIVDPADAMGFQDGGGGNAFSRSRIRNGQGSDPIGQQTWHHTWATEALRVLKPGAHLVAFSGTRTSHRMVCAIEDAGFEIRDSLVWLHGQGFPKSKNLGNGYGSALKPGHEPICLARKPLIGTIQATVERYGTGALNIAATRVGTGADKQAVRFKAEHVRTTLNAARDGSLRQDAGTIDATLGRWPANVCLSEDAAAALDATVGERVSRFFLNVAPDDELSRAFYCAKASRAERNAGLEGMPERRSGTGALRSEQGGEYVIRVNDPDAAVIAAYLTEWRERRGLSRADMDARLGTVTMYSWYEGRPAGTQLPTPETWLLLKDILGFDETHDDEMTVTRTVPHAERDGPVAVKQNHHPTVKPLALMRWLCTLITPPGGTILDPFMGSASTLVAAIALGFDCIGIEADESYLAIAQARVDHAEQHAGFGPLFNQAAD